MWPGYLDPTLIPRVTVPPWTSCNRLYVEFLANGWTGIPLNKRHVTLFQIWIIILDEIIKTVIQYSVFLWILFHKIFIFVNFLPYIFYVNLECVYLYPKITTNIAFYWSWCKIKAAVHTFFFFTDLEFVSFLFYLL